MAKLPLVIGLTGGIGSGKSTVADLFAELGTPVIDADLISRELVMPGTTVYKKIIAYFGKNIVDENGVLRRRALREIIFRSAIDKAWLEVQLHPEIYKIIQIRINEIKNPYVIIVIPLLLEVGRQDFIDRVLVIDAPEHLQKTRAAQRDNVSATQIDVIVQSQYSREKRLICADDVITNDGNLMHLKAQVLKLHEYYLSFYR